MPGPIGTSDSCLPPSPVNCRWAALAKHEANESNLIDLPPSEQVSRGKELLSMLWSEDEPFPAGNNSLAMPEMPHNDAILPPVPPPPSDMPPAPPGFEVSSSYHSHRIESSAQLQHNHGQQPGNWVMPPTGPSEAPVQQQSHFSVQRSPQNTPPMWGMGNAGLGAGSPGAWTPLSTNPGTMSGGWLSTGVSDRDGSAVAVSSATMTHVASSGSSAHAPYSMPPSNADNGLWMPAAASSANTTSAPLAPSSMGVVAAGLQNAMPSVMMQAQKPGLPNQLRAEAAPYVPMNMGVGVPAC